MKNLDLNAYGVEEMENVEVRETNGGIWQFILGAILGGIISDLVLHPGDVADSYSKGAAAANAKWDNM